MGNRKQAKPTSYGRSVWGSKPPVQPRAGKTNKPFLCRIGLHVYMFKEDRDVVEPKRGPFDPRSEEGRTYKESFDVCVCCGAERITTKPGYVEI